MNMVHLTAFLNVIKHLSAVVLCVPFNFKNDLSYSKTIPYYARLLRPLFDARQAFLALTNVNSESYELFIEEKSWASMLEGKLEGVNSILTGASCPTIDVALPFNTIYPKSTLNRLFQGKDVQNLLLYASIESRRMLLNFVAFNRVPLTNLSLPLPPAVEDGRRSALAACRARIEGANETVRIESDKRFKQLKEQDELITQINQNWAQLMNHQNQIKILGADIRTEPKFISGNDLFHINPPEHLVRVTSPIPPFGAGIQSHGCTYAERENVGQNERVFSVRRNFFTFGR